VNFSHWTAVEHSVKITATHDLPTTVEEYGYVKRQFGVSARLMELLGFENATNALEELHSIVEQGEVMALNALRQFLKENTNPQAMGLARDRYFPMIQFTVQLDNGVNATICVVVNEREDGIASWNRFVAIVAEDEAADYQTERTTL
jgi:hypothetical protein